MENQIQETEILEEEEKHPTWSDVQDPYLQAYNRIVYAYNLVVDGYSEEVVGEYFRQMPMEEVRRATAMSKVITSLSPEQRETMVNKITSGAMYEENMPVEEGLFH